MHNTLAIQCGQKYDHHLVSRKTKEEEALQEMLLSAHSRRTYLVGASITHLDTFRAHGALEHEGYTFLHLDIVDEEVLRRFVKSHVAELYLFNSIAGGTSSLRPDRLEKPGVEWKIAPRDAEAVLAGSMEYRFLSPAGLCLSMIVAGLRRERDLMALSREALQLRSAIRTAQAALSIVEDYGA